MHTIRRRGAILILGKMKMFTRREATKFMITLSTMALLSAASFAMPTHAFLETPVHSTSELVSEIVHNRTVLDRYERHFAMTGDEVLEYMKNLHVARMPVTKRMKIYLCREDGDLDFSVQTVKQGTPVFADSMGRPILEVACGNPMVAPKRDAMSMAPPTSISSDKTELANIGDTIAPEMAMSALSVAPEVAMIPDVAPVIALTGSGPELIPGGLTNILPLGLLPLIGFAGPNHNSPLTPPPPVPEPTTIIALGAGITAVVARRRKK
jgi:hypothetical protein